MMKIVADNKIPFLEGAFEAFAEISYIPGKDIKAEDVKDADALIVRTRTKCNADLLTGSSVKFIATATIGFDHIDTEYCEKNNIQWTNAPGCNSSSVEQYIASVLLELAVLKNIKLSEKSIGIVGVGNVGSKVANIAETLGMKVLLNDPPRERNEGSEGFVDLSTIASEADIISFHVPLKLRGNDSTWHLVDMDFLNFLKPETILINSSRGEVVDNESLSHVLDARRIKTAILDVWENEPDIDKELLDMLAIATPHIAGYSTDGKANGTEMSVRAISRFFKLGIDDWKVKNVPAPERPVMVVDCSHMNPIEIIHSVYTKIYNVFDDSDMLKRNPDEFEKQRGEYRNRRESKAYSVRLNDNSYEEVPQILEKLGFSVLEIDCFC